MAKRIVVVHDDGPFLGELLDALGEDQLDAAGFADPLDALDALESGSTIELLVTRVRFPDGRGNGLALANMARLKASCSKILFVGLEEYRSLVVDLGEFLAWPVSPERVRAAVRSMLAGDPAPPAGDAP